ncbi:MAG: efflux RND transporter permease subunit [Georgfuchsia sp.]
MKDVTFHRLESFVEACIRRRAAVAAVFTLLTVVMGFFAVRVEVKTVFDDLLPRTHAYVKVHERFRQDFGGSNMVSIMVEVEQGDIFKTPVLEKVKKLTNDLALVNGVNSFQIISLASNKLKEIKASTDSIDVQPVMGGNVPTTAEGLEALKNTVLNNSMVYGTYVSQDIKAALITVDFYENAVDYSKIFPQVMKLVNAAQGDGVRVSVVGEPILYGWVDHYVPETVHIFLMTIGCLMLLLFLAARTWRGTLLPLLAGFTSAIWALGFARLMGYNLDPLVIVIAFLITARSISHSVQLVTRFGDELAAGVPTSKAAASSAMLQLFKPGMLGVVADAGCMIVVILTPIPLMQKISLIGTVWVLTIAICACVMTPVLLSWLKPSARNVHPINIYPLLDGILNICVRVATTRWRYALLLGAAAVFVVSGIYAFKLQVGDADAGSPILWQDSSYNKDSAAINSQFQGADRMYVVFEGKQPGAVKELPVLNNMASMQRFMGAQPQIGGSLSLADVIPSVNQVMRENNPRYRDLGKSAIENGELLYMWSADASDTSRFMDPQAQITQVTLFFKDHRGDTIRTAIQRVKEFIAAHPIEQGVYVLAGGLIGVTAAVNEVIFAGQIESIALALLVLIICCAVAYRSLRAGIFFMVPVILSNTITFSVMAWQGIGMTLSTLPVAALGIGLGVDYAFYVVDGIREELRGHSDLKQAIVQSLHSAGKGVLITSLTLTASVVLWFASSLRFQAEMGILMAIWLFVSSFSALFIMPAMVYVFKPDFVTHASKKAASASISGYEVSAVSAN